MSRTEMQRTFTTTNVDFAIIENVDGNIEVVKQSPIQLGGKLSNEQALKVLKREEDLKTKNIVVTSVEHEDALYTMPIKDFLSLATKTSTKPEQTDLSI